MTFFIVLLFVVLAIVGIVIWRRRAARKVGAVLGAKIDGMADAALRGNELTVLQSQIDDAAEQVAQNQQQLAQYKGNLNMLSKQCEQNKSDITRLTARAKKAIQEGNDQRASQHLLQKKRIEAELAQNQKQQEQYGKMYEGALTQLKHANSRVSQARENAKNLKNQLDMSKYTKSMSDMAQSFHVDTGRFDDMKTLENAILADVEANNASAEVSQDLYGEQLNTIAEEEALEQLEAADELAKMKAEMSSNSEVKS